MSTRVRIVVVGVALLLVIEAVMLWDQVGIWAVIGAVVIAALLGGGYLLGRSARSD